MMSLSALILAIFMGADPACDQALEASLKSETALRWRPIKFNGVQTGEGKGEFLLGWKNDPNYELNESYQNAKRLAVIAVPVGNADARNIFSLDGGGVKQFSYPATTTSGSISVTLDDKDAYFLYIGGYGCDLEREIKRGLVSWRMFTGLDRKPIPLSRPNDDRPVFNLVKLIDNNGVYSGVLLLADFSTKPEQLAITVAASGVDLGVAKDWKDDGAGELKSVYDGGIHNKIYPGAYNWRWSVWMPPEKVSTTSASAVSITLKNVVSGGSQTVKIPLQDDHWSNAQAALAKAVLKDNSVDIASSDYAAFVTELFRNGGYIDEGERLSIEVDWMRRDNPGKTPGYEDLVEYSRRARVSSMSFAQMVNFASPTEINVFSEALTRIDVQSIMGQWISTDAGTAGTARDLETAVSAYRGKFILSWAGDVSLLCRNRSTNVMRVLPSKRYNSSDLAFALPDNNDHYLLIGREELLDIMNGGLWASSDKSTESQFYEGPSVPSEGKFVLNVSDYPFRTRSARCIAFQDSRAILGAERVKYDWDQTGYKNSKNLTRDGFDPVWHNRVLLPTKNAATMRLASTSLGDNGPPSMSLLNWKMTGYDFGDVTIASRKGNEFDLLVTTAPSSVDEGEKYQALISLRDDKGGDRIVVPLEYQVTGRVHYLLLSGKSTDENARKTNQAFAAHYAQRLAVKGQYLEVIDMSDWRWGSVYWHGTGLSLSEKAALELRLIADGVPKVSTTSQTRAPILPGSMMVFGKGNYSNIPESEREKLEEDLGGELDENEYSFISVSPDFMKLSPKAMAVFNPSLMCATTSGGGSPFCFEPKWMQDLTWAAPDIALQTTKDILFDIATFNGYSYYTAISEARNGRYLFAAITALPLLHDLKSGFKGVGKAIQNADDVAVGFMYNDPSLYHGIEEMALDVVAKSRSVPSKIPDLVSPGPIEDVTLSEFRSYLEKNRRVFDGDFDEFTSMLFAHWKNEEWGILERKMKSAKIRSDPTIVKFNDGYPPTLGCKDDLRRVTLKPGYRFDRYSTGKPDIDGGDYVGMIGDSYDSRSLDPDKKYDRYCFEVLKDISAIWCSAAPWFGKPGGAMQAKFDKGIKDIVLKKGGTNSSSALIKAVSCIEAL